MNLAKAIANAPWMLDPALIPTYGPLAVQFLRGQLSAFPQASAAPVLAFDPITGAFEDEDEYNDESEPKSSGRIMIYPVKGIITKDDQYCGPTGTETLMRRMKQYDADPNVMGHFLEIDSGGGEGTNMDTVCRTVRGLKKPVVAWFNGVCASAAYYMAAGATEIYAGQATDAVGSIGVFIAFADMREYWESMGVHLHEIYADQSDLKNADYHAARDGDYKPIKTEFLNPFASVFISTMKEMRPALQNEEAYRGKMFMAPEAAAIGMIDGILTKEAALERIVILSVSYNQNSTNMSFKRLFGMDSTPATPSAEDQLRDALVKMEEQMEAQATQLAQLTQTIDKISQQTENVAARLTSIETARATQPGAPVALTALPTEPPLTAVEPAADAFDAFEKSINSLAADGVPMRIQ